MRNIINHPKASNRRSLLLLISNSLQIKSKNMIIVIDWDKRLLNLSKKLSYLIKIVRIIFTKRIGKIVVIYIKKLFK